MCYNNNVYQWRNKTLVALDHLQGSKGLSAEALLDTKSIFKDSPHAVKHFEFRVCLFTIASLYVQDAFCCWSFPVCCKVTRMLAKSKGTKATW